MDITWGMLLLAAAVLVVWGMTHAVRFAKDNVNHYRHLPDPKTGMSQDEWMEAIR